MNNLSQTIESILFATAEEYTVNELSGLLKVSKEEIENALATLAESLEGHGMMLVRERDSVTLATRAEHAPILETIRKEELQKDLSKASAETLAVVVYKPGATKAEIELIRGVNASYSLRALQIRGLIESKGAGRAVTYHPTLALLEHYGVSDAGQLPQYQETVQKIASLISQTEEV
ncbi:MAG TPA: SMC-Scp complex subunit ScpB [Candidatus Paceibacterota bacterium]|jgi:segregation and condensation protein B|nr:SMC-Scp complex subunit ScpB [Candidatus Paceibacterota bacterium]